MIADRTIAGTRRKDNGTSVRPAGYTPDVTSLEPVDSAKASGLRYITDERPGIRRVKRRGGFRYLDLNGKPISDEKDVARIRKLAIPPAYSDVWSSAHSGQLDKLASLFQAAGTQRLGNSIL